MQLRDGMLGVVIVAIAIAVALFGAYLAGVEPEEHQVTKYKYLTDAVSGMFEYDQTPQYIEFDPSTNYTGYYSEDSYSEFRNKYFFAKDQVGFIQNQSVNNYRVDIEPNRLYYDGNHTITPASGGNPWDGEDHKINLYIAKSWETGSQSSGISVFTNKECYVRSLNKQITTEMDLLGDEYSTATTIYFVSHSNLDTDDLEIYKENDVDWVLFSLKSNWHERHNVGQDAVNPGHDEHDLYVAQDMALSLLEVKEYDTAVDPLTKIKVSRPYVACKYDVAKQNVTLYTDISMEEKYAYGPYNAKDVFMCFGDDEPTPFVPQPGTGTFNMSMSVEMEVEERNTNTYLNPNYGVWLRGAVENLNAKVLYETTPTTYEYKLGTEISIIAFQDFSVDPYEVWSVPGSRDKSNFILSQDTVVAIEHYVGDQLDGTVNVTFKVER